MIAHEHRSSVSPGIGRRALYLVALALAPVACVVLYLFNPAADDDPYPNCPFFLLTGFFCPGCGSLRAYHQLLRGNVGVALGLNPLTVLALPAMIYALATAWVAGYRGLPPRGTRWSAGAAWAMGAVLVVFGVMRNVPVDALEWMRP